MRRFSLHVGLLCTLAVAVSSACATIVGDFEFKNTGTGGSKSSGTGGSTSSSSAGTGGSTSSSSTGSTSSGTGGSACGAGTACAGPDDCPDPMNECQIRTCSMGCCGTSNVGNGVATMNGQSAGDCMKRVCNGNGAAIEVDDDGDAPDDQNPCTKDICNAGSPAHPPQAGDLGVCMLDGMPAVCGDPAGAAKGTCVVCNVTADCTGGDSCSVSANVCVPVGCMNGVKDGNETALDCGGADCGATCADGLACLVDGDCLNRHCVGGTCTLPTCNDAAVDGNETDVDCGGAAFKGAAACSRCADNHECAINADCANGFCDLTVNPPICKTPTCTDGQKNGNETGIDCGGAACDILAKTCPVGTGCVNGSDCTSTFCNNGSCALRAFGAACASGVECAAPGACVDGVCCDAACNGTCTACSAAKKGSGADGHCDNVAALTDPNNQCAASTPDTCGLTGNCDGNGACAKWPAGTVCRAAAGPCDVAETCDGTGDPCPADAFLAAGAGCGTNKCVSGVYTSSTCDAAHSCVPSPMNCPLGTVCKTQFFDCLASCGSDSPTGDANCASGFYCDGTHCQFVGEVGDPCTRGGQCGSGHCLLSGPSKGCQ